MKIFISYRRQDSQHQAGRLYDQLIHVFGPEQVFKDVESIPVGADFREALRLAVDDCDVVLVLIGDLWLLLRDRDKRPRLQSPSDFVRIEIESALIQNVPVVPVLVGSQPMPTADQLPSSIRELAFRQGVTIRPDPFFHSDLAQLLSALKRLSKDSPGKSKRGLFQGQVTQVMRALGVSTRPREKAPPVPKPSRESRSKGPKGALPRAQQPLPRPPQARPQPPQSRPKSPPARPQPPQSHQPPQSRPNTPSARPQSPQARPLPPPPRPQPPRRAASVGYRQKVHSKVPQSNGFPHGGGPLHLFVQLKVAAALLALSALASCLYWAYITFTDTSEVSLTMRLSILAFVGGVNGVALLGGIVAFRLKWYGWAIAGALMSMIPLFGVFFGFALPLGVWLLVLLLNRQVKAAFR